MRRAVGDSARFDVLPSRWVAAGFVMLAASLAATSANAATLPPGFSEQPLTGSYNVPVQVRFTEDGAWTFVLEKAGRVWAHDGTSQAPSPMTDLVDEVNNDHDRGLLGFATHPGWTPDGGDTSWAYYLFTQTPVYGQDYAYNQSSRYSFSRLIRCRTTLVDGWPVTDYTDEDGDGVRCQTLLGHQDADGHVNDGITSLHNSHATGDLHFGADGTLLVVNGDGAHYNFQDNGGADAAGFQDYALSPPPGESAPWYGPSPVHEDSGAFRSQDLRSFSGKVLRIDPETGLGLPSNPYWTGDASDPQSRVLAGGLRNPYRSAMKPGTGSTNPADGNPGTLYLGEVGWGTWEEINVLSAGGENFGWPNYEGLNAHGGYSSYTRSTNTLGMPDGQSLGGKNDPAAFKTHDRPIVAWHHSNASQLRPTGLHAGFKGNSATGGDFYTGTSYPAEYANAYFFADYGQSWIKVIRLTDNDVPVEILDFATNAQGPVDLTRHPITGDIYYVSVFTGQVRRIVYGSNSPPSAALQASPSSGSAPLVATLDASASSDGEQAASTLRYDWDFGDGATALDAGPTLAHTWTDSGSYVVTVTVTDFDGASDTASATIDVDNTPPTAIIVAPADGSLYSLDALGLIDLVGAGTDAQDAESALTFSWEVRLHHLDAEDPSQAHVHPDVYNSNEQFDSFAMEDHGSDGDIINLEVRLTVTDTDGASDTAVAFLLDPEIGIYPWRHRDIGPVVPGADVRVDQWGFDLSGAGTGFGANDALHFVYKTATGDFSLVTRVSDLTDAAAPLAGLMVRSSFDDDAPFAALVADGAAAVGAWWRTTDANATSGGSTPNTFGDLWLRIERVGTDIILSVVGATDWETVSVVDGSTLPNSLYVGMLVASGDNAALATGAFRDTSLTVATACGNFIIEPGEACDDGNLDDGDCCSPECQIEPAGTVCGRDGNACTVGACQADVCQITLVEGPCNDGDVCTENDQCAGATCAGSAVSCDDGNPCTVDSCGTGGCANDPTSGATCDDGDACTDDDACVDGACAGNPLSCDDGNLCTLDACVAGECTFTPNTAACDDGDACTTDDTCAAGACAGSALSCDDGNPCTDDTCEDGACTNAPNTANCDDGDACTSGDACADGACLGSALSCDDGNPCTDDSCVAGSCTHAPNTAACDDGDPCTSGDVCANGTCAGTGSCGGPCVDADGDGYDSCSPGQPGDDGSPADCDDLNPLARPLNTEYCNGFDDNCDGQVDEGYDQDDDGITQCQGDCDDNNAQRAPGFAEVCDGIDNDCDWTVDEGFDEDGDGWTTCAGDCDDDNVLVKPNNGDWCNLIDDDCDGQTDEDSDADGDGVAFCAGDCNDGDATVRPGQAEVCNQVDDNCDGSVDEGEVCAAPCTDLDGDGYDTCSPGQPGDDGQPVDCNDGVGTTFPGAPELCNTVDDDCDGQADEGWDVDADGVTVCQGDCDDNNPDVAPGRDEVCDGLDNDCNTLVDEAPGGGSVCIAPCADADADGFDACSPGEPGDDGKALDCNDDDASISPGATELCDGVDQDCDLAVDEGFDSDGDGYSSCTECDDTNAAVNPGAAEVCDGVDNNCDALVDLTSAGQDVCAAPCVDADGDGFDTCSPGQLGDDGAPLDCDDTNPAVKPQDGDWCNGIDDNCDGQIDEGYDTDGDGVTTCAGDCDDTDPAVAPGALEICDGVDNDCDWTIDEGFDQDGDGWTTCAGDCDDNDILTKPQPDDWCDGLDNNCNGEVDEGC